MAENFTEESVEVARKVMEVRGRSKFALENKRKMVKLRDDMPLPMISEIGESESVSSL